jgi:hypothetical protein
MAHNVPLFTKLPTAMGRLAIWWSGGVGTRSEATTDLARTEPEPPKGRRSVNILLCAGFAFLVFFFQTIQFYSFLLLKIAISWSSSSQDCNLFIFLFKRLQFLDLLLQKIVVF